MDRAEEIVERLLSDMGFANIAPEPDGNRTPDFVINGRIAVEVRRLTQIHDDGNKVQALSEVSIPLSQKFEKLLNSFEKIDERSWWVAFGYKRPLPSWKHVLGPQLRRALEEFALSTEKRDGTIFDTPHFDVDVRETSNPFDRLFVMAVMQDREAGGWVVGEFLKSISYCIEEKSRKVTAAGVRHKYKEWWLALVNQTGLALDDHDRGELLAILPPHPDWEKVLLVTASDPPRHFEC